MLVALKLTATPLEGTPDTVYRVAELCLVCGAFYFKGVPLRWVCQDKISRSALHRGEQPCDHPFENIFIISKRDLVTLLSFEPPSILETTNSDLLGSGHSFCVMLPYFTVSILVSFNCHHTWPSQGFVTASERKPGQYLLCLVSLHFHNILKHHSCCSLCPLFLFRAE